MNGSTSRDLYNNLVTLSKIAGAGLKMSSTAFALTWDVIFSVINAPSCA